MECSPRDRGILIPLTRTIAKIRHLGKGNEIRRGAVKGRVRYAPTVDIATRRISDETKAPLAKDVGQLLLQPQAQRETTKHRNNQ